MTRTVSRRSAGRALLGAALFLAGGPHALRGQEAPAAPPTTVQVQDEAVRRVSLDESLEIASRNSPALEQARANLTSTRSQQTAAVGSFLPSVSLGYGFSKASTGRLDPTQQSITRQSYTASLSGSVTLFDGFRRLHELESARRSVDAQEATYEQRRYETALNVKVAFYNAVAARERIRVEEARVERQEEQLDFVRDQFRLGRSTRSDTLRSRVDLNDARLALMNAENDARNASFILAESMGVRERVAPAEQASLDVDTLRWPVEELISRAVERSPRVEAARRSVEASEAGVAGAKSAYYPSFSLSGGYDWSNDAFPPENRSWSFSVRGSLPLFNGLQRETSIRRAEAQVEAARAQERAAELAVRSEVQSAYNESRTAMAGLDLAEETVAASSEDLRVTQQRFRLGVATSLDLRSAQIALEQAEVDVIRRKFDYQVAVARLENLLGADLEELDPTGPSTSGTP